MAMPILVTGATGRIGRALRAGWGSVDMPELRPVWQARRAEPGFTEWDILRQSCPETIASGVVLCLAGGRLAGDAEVQLAMASLRAARDQKARHVFVMSSAAVYDRSDVQLSEDATPAPLAAYGRQKQAMEREARHFAATEGLGLTVLRLGNVAGFDALLGGARPGVPVALDPVKGQTGGPVRSYIGPASLGRILMGFVKRAAVGANLPDIVNIAAPAPVAMADLLDAAGIAWHFGSVNPDVLARVVLDTGRLQSLLPEVKVPSSPGAMIAEWQGLR